MTNVYILTGKIASGKTTGLLDWLGDKRVGGFVTPVINGKRMIFSLIDRCYLPFECVDSDEQKVEQVGRYRFYQEAFASMNTILEQASMLNLPLLIIDEIGPLELRGGGLHGTLMNLLAQRKQTLLLVVRAGLVEVVLKTFAISPKAILGKEDLKQFAVN